MEEIYENNQKLIHLNEKMFMSFSVILCCILAWIYFRYFGTFSFLSFIIWLGSLLVGVISYIVRYVQLQKLSKKALEDIKHFNLFNANGKTILENLKKAYHMPLFPIGLNRKIGQIDRIIRTDADIISMLNDKSQLFRLDTNHEKYNYLKNIYKMCEKIIKQYKINFIVFIAVIFSIIGVFSISFLKLKIENDYMLYGILIAYMLLFLIWLLIFLQYYNCIFFIINKIERLYDIYELNEEESLFINTIYDKLKTYDPNSRNVIYQFWFLFIKMYFILNQFKKQLHNYKHIIIK